VGDWDLRSASELTSYLTQHEYRATIASPIYAPKPGNAGVDQAYILHLGKLLHGRNCIVVASPEVNAFTELVLGYYYGLPIKDLFHGGLDADIYNRAIVAVKQTTGTPAPAGHALYVEESVTASGKPLRGFRSRRIKAPEGKIMEPFVNQMDPPAGFEVYAHLAIIPNLFNADGEYKSDGYGKLPRRHIIVLNGVSGPATFALTHVLTGGVSREFVNYGTFDPTRQSEEEIANILRGLELSKTSQRGPAVERIFSVSVVPDPASAATPATKDWRQIASWAIHPVLDVQ
jgi:hypothetical protein